MLCLTFGLQVFVNNLWLARAERRFEEERRATGGAAASPNICWGREKGRLVNP